MTQVAEALPHEGVDQFDRTLRENTHPPDWQNPTPGGRYNLVVIGAGTAGPQPASALNWRSRRRCGFIM